MELILKKYLAASYGKTPDTAIVMVCIPATKISPTAGLSLLTSLFVLDGMKIVQSEIEKIL